MEENIKRLKEIRNQITDNYASAYFQEATDRVYWLYRKINRDYFNHKKDYEVLKEEIHKQRAELAQIDELLSYWESLYER